MGKIIKRHNFEKAKNRLLQFSKEQQEAITFKRIEEEGWFFGLNDRDVTGKEFNASMSVIQKHLIGFGENILKIKKEFGQIYNALDVIDKDYIDGILTAIQAAEQTSEGVKIAQERLEKITTDQESALNILVPFKEKMDSYQHLHKIDTMWDNHQEWQIKIESLTDSIKSAMAYSETNSKTIEELGKIQEVANDKITKLETILNRSSNQINDALANVEQSVSKISDLQKQSEQFNIEIKKIKTGLFAVGGLAMIAVVAFVFILAKIL